jgi:hypothetical protein
MSAATMTREDRAERRARLTLLIARASAELLDLERADRRPTPTIVDPPPTTGIARKAASARIRAWATTQGLPLGPRGPIPTAIRDAYTAAHPEQEPTS